MLLLAPLLFSLAHLPVSQQTPTTLPSFPYCGQGCLTDQLDNAGSVGCENSNMSCLCRSPDFESALKGCVQRSCTSRPDRAAVLSVISDFCRSLQKDGTEVVTAKGSSSSKITRTTYITATPINFVISTRTPINPSSADLALIGSAFTILPTLSGYMFNQTDPLTASESSTSDATLTTNDKIGVGVGVPFGVLFGCALSGYLVYRRYQRKRNPNLSISRMRTSTITGLAPDQDKEVVSRDPYGADAVDSLVPLTHETQRERASDGGPSELHGNHLDLQELPGSRLVRPESGGVRPPTSELDGTENTFLN